MTDYPPSHQPVVYAPPPSQEWGAALVLTCLVMGFAISWGTYELRLRLNQQQSVANFRHDLDDLNAQQSDLGRLMADPRTRFVWLTPADGYSPVRSASVAWNNDRQSGILFCGDLAAAPQERYQIRLISTSGEATLIPLGPARLGVDVYPFSPTRPAQSPSEIILTPADQAARPLATGKLTD